VRGRIVGDEGERERERERESLAGHYCQDFGHRTNMDAEKEQETAISSTGRGTVRKCYLL
jgi:hypothetical protein